MRRVPTGTRAAACRGRARCRSRAPTGSRAAASARPPGRRRRRWRCRAREVDAEHHRRARAARPLAEDAEPRGRDVGRDARRTRRGDRVPPRLVGRVAADADRRRAVAARGQRLHEPGEDRVRTRAAEVALRRPVLHREARERARDRRARPCRRPSASRPAASSSLPSAASSSAPWPGGTAIIAALVVPSSAIARYVANATAGVEICQLPSIPVGTVASDSQGVAPPARRRWTVTWCAAAGADLAPDDVVAEVDPDRVVEVGERGLRVAVDVVQARLPAGVLAPARDRLVLPEVLGQQHDARVVPGDVRGLLEVAVLGAGRDAAQAVGRVGLVAVLVEPQAERRRRAPQAVQALQAVEQALDLLQAPEVGVVAGARTAGSARGACCAGGRRSRRRSRAGTRGRRRCGPTAGCRRRSRARAGTRAGACSRCRS